MTRFSASSGYNLIENQIKESLRYLVDFYSKHREPVNLSITGDVFQYSTPRFDLIMFMMDFLNSAAKVFDNIYIIPGNHDFKNMKSYGTDFIAYLNLSNVHYITPDSDRFIFEVVDGVKGLYLPYFEMEKENNQTIQSFIDKVRSKEGSADILFAHLHDSQCRLGSERNVMTKFVTDIDFSEFSKEFKYIISGHIHKRQTYKVKDTIVIFPGSFHPLTSADIQERKYCLEIEKGDNGIKFNNIDYPQVEFIKRDKNTLSDLPEGSGGRTFVVFYFCESMDFEAVELINSIKESNPHILHIQPVLLQNSENRAISDDGNDFDSGETEVFSFNDLVSSNISELTLEDNIKKDISSFFEEVVG